jgi:hypothetical protein
LDKIPVGFFRKIASWLLGGLLALGALSAQAAPQSGWWWNTNESGRGFFIEIDDGWFFLSGYFYDDAGHATWLVSNDPMPAANSYQGRLLALSDGQSLMGEYRPPSAPRVAGTVAVQFSDDNHATLTWPGGTVAIERYNFHSPQPATFTPFVGWWWNPAESGRGMSVELQGQHMFIGVYMYEEDGRPVWYVADAMMSTPKRFVAPLLQFANGQTMSGSYRAPTAPRTVGTITVDFSGPDRAMVTLSDDAPTPGVAGAKAGRSKMFVIEPQKKKNPADRPARFFGNFKQVLVQTGANATTITIDGTVTWETLASSEVAPLDSSTVYGIYKGHVDVKLTGVIDQGTEICSASGKGSQDLFPFDGHLVVGADGSYRGKIDYNMPITITACGMTMTFPFPLLVQMQGKLSGTTMDGDSSGTTTGNARETNHWHFIAGG